MVRWQRNERPVSATPQVTLVVSGQPYIPRDGDRFIYDSRNGTLFVHNADDDDVYFRVGDQLVSRHAVGQNLSKQAAREVVDGLLKAWTVAGALSEVEGSFSSLFTFLLTV